MAKPVYDQAQVIRALTTADGTADSAAWGRDQISYSLSSPVIAEGEPYYSPYYEGYVPLTPEMEARAREAFALWDDLIDVELIELPETAEQELGLRANILFNRSTNTEDGLSYTLITYTDEPNDPRSTDTIVDTEVWLAARDPALDRDADVQDGALGFLVYLHQIGHALGLTHGGPYNVAPGWEADATHHQDTRQYTVLSPFEATANSSGTDHAGAYAATPLLHDILAAQALYGADMTTRTGDTTYGFNATAGRAAFDFTQNTRPVVGIWDAGGTDTLDVSGFAHDQTVDLNEGAFSSVGGLTDNVAIAFGAAIENAVGGGGNDRLTGTAAANRLDGGGGNDRLAGGAGGDRLDGGTGHDNLAGGGGSDVLLGRGGSDTLLGGDGRDHLHGGAGDDSLDGGTGDDDLTGGAGADALDGGPGNDSAVYADATAGVQVDLDRPGLNTGIAAGDTHAGIENVAGSDFDDRLSGDAVGNTLWGQDGDDVLQGRGGADALAGGAGRDRLHGGPGDDQLAGGSGDDDLMGGAGADGLNGGPGNDSALYGDANTGVHVDLVRPFYNRGIAAGDVYGSIENVAGSDHGDVLRADDGDNLLWGRGGDDFLYGRGGRDALAGADGDDRLDGGAGDDVLGGGAGDDDLVGGAGADDLNGGAGNDTALYVDARSGVVADLVREDLNRGIATGDTYRGIENLAGSDFGDTLRADSGDNRIWGRDGDDAVYARGGDDAVAGGAGDDRLFGAPGHDRLNGGPGDDALSGGDGIDGLTGGAGADRFVFLDGHDRDTVGDFDRRTDTLALGRDLWGGADLTAQQVVNRYASLSGDDVIFDFGGGDSIALLGVGTLALAADLQLV